MGSPEHPQFEPAPNEKASVVLILFQFVLQFLEADWPPTPLTHDLALIQCLQTMCITLLCQFKLVLCFSFPIQFLCPTDPLVISLLLLLQYCEGPAFTWELSLSWKEWVCFLVKPPGVSVCLLLVPECLLCWECLSSLLYTPWFCLYCLLVSCILLSRFFFSVLCSNNELPHWLGRGSFTSMMDNSLTLVLCCSIQFGNPDEMSTLWVPSVIAFVTLSPEGSESDSNSFVLVLEITSSCEDSLHEFSFSFSADETA